MTVVVVAAPVPWVPACAGTTVRGRGCRWGITVVVVAAPVPWVPAYAGTTVRGRGCRWGITVVVAAPVGQIGRRGGGVVRGGSDRSRGLRLGVGRSVFRMFMGVAAPVPWVPACRQPSSIGRGVAVGPRSESGMTRRGSGMTNAGLATNGRLRPHVRPRRWSNRRGRFA